MNVIDTIFKTHWGLSRWLRLVIGVAFLFDSVYKETWFVAAMGGVLIAQSIFNLGCAGKACAPPTKKDGSALPDLSKSYRKL